MKIYKHTGRGIWIGSCIIVKARDVPEAQNLIRHELNSAGLSKEVLNIVEVTDEIIYVDNGDY